MLFIYYSMFIKLYLLYPIFHSLHLFLKSLYLRTVAISKKKKKMRSKLKKFGFVCFLFGLFIYVFAFAFAFGFNSKIGWLIKTNHPPELISNTNINAQQPKRIVIVTFHINIHSYTITLKQQQYPEPSTTSSNNKNSCEICSIERLIFWFSCRIQAIKFQHTDARRKKKKSF